MWMEGATKPVPPQEAQMTEQEEKKVQISVHLTEPLREQLEAAARRSIRSLSAEAAYRIRQSLESEQQSAA
jgi:TraY domain